MAFNYTGTWYDEEGDLGYTDLTFGIERTSGDQNSDVHIRWVVEPSYFGGVTGSDFDTVLPSGTFTLAAGCTDGLLTISVLGDTDVEYDELFFVRLVDATGGVIDPFGSVDFGYIVNDDVENLYSIVWDGAYDDFEGDTGSMNTGFPSIAAAISPPSQPCRGPCWAWPASMATTLLATCCLRYSTFSVGVTQIQITLQVAGDVVVEGSEFFAVVLSDPSSGFDIDSTDYLVLLCTSTTMPRRRKFDHPEHRTG